MHAFAFRAIRRWQAGTVLRQGEGALLLAAQTTADGEVEATGCHVSEGVQPATVALRASVTDERSPAPAAGAAERVEVRRLFAQVAGRGAGSGGLSVRLVATLSDDNVVAVQQVRADAWCPSVHASS